MITWFIRLAYVSLGFCVSTLIAHAEIEYATHPAWHIPLGVIAVGWLALLVGVAEGHR